MGFESPITIRETNEFDGGPTIVDSGRMLATEFGEYLIISRLGHGGMGTVDLAIHAPPGGVERPVALKRLRQHLGEDPSFVKMFQDEVRIAARLSHPHIASLLHAGEHEGRWFYAMDLLFGASLSNVMRHIASTQDPDLTSRWPAVVCKLIADACEGLHAAHELRDDQDRLLDVVHRDVTPANLFVGFDGGVRVIDFGIASAHDRLESTNIGVIKGKLAYVAPERLDSHTTVDRRVDVWGLGVTLWEALAFEWLFRRTQPLDTVKAIRDAEIPPLSGYRTDVPPEIEAVIHKALQVDPDLRYPTARAMGIDLLQAIRRSGWSVDLPQVSEWMNDLLPDAAHRQQRLARMATVARRSTVQLQRSELDEAPQESGKRERTPGDAMATIEDPRPPSVEPADRIAPIWFVTIGVLLGALIVALSWLIATDP